MICPACGVDVTIDPADIINQITICPNCIHSLVIAEDGSARQAVAADTVPLSDNDRAQILAVRRRFRTAK